jgi:hypothetical protein
LEAAEVGGPAGQLDVDAPRAELRKFARNDAQRPQEQGLFGHDLRLERMQTVRNHIQGGSDFLRAERLGQVEQPEEAAALGAGQGRQRAAVFE